MPVSSTELQQQPFGPPVSSGNRDLDAILGGGFRRASCILVAGASGTGKTTVASSFSAAASARGERVLYISFEESAQMLTDTMLSSGIDLRSPVTAGKLRILTAMPESLGIEEHLLRIFGAIDAFGPDHVIVDAISASRRMGTERAAFDFLVRLSSRCREEGMTCILTNQVGPGTSTEHLSGFGISSLVDTLIHLEQVWPAGTHQRRLLVIKARGSSHSHEYHTFAIGDQGIDISLPRRGGTPAGQQEDSP